MCLSCTVAGIFSVEFGVTLKSGLEPRGHSRLLKIVPFESLGIVSYSHGCFDTIHERDRYTPHDGIGRRYA